MHNERTGIYTMVEPDSIPSCHKFEYILNWISDEAKESSPIWTESDTNFDCEYCHSIAESLEKSDSGIDIVLQNLTPWRKFKM